MTNKNTKIKIKKSSNADSRTAVGDVTKENLLTHTKSHRKDVKAIMNYCAQILKKQGKIHDFTKIDYIDSFYDDFNTARKGEIFTELDWYKLHVETEKHHPNAKCHEDVNLFDIIEMICDCVVAGLARSGEYREVEIPSEILQKAFANTAEMLIKVCEIKE